MRVFYFITKLLTFPGAILRAYLEQCTCRIFRIPIENNHYLRSGEMCGHVEHEFARGRAKSYFLCFLPGLVSFLFACILVIPCVINMFYLGKYSFGFSLSLANWQATGQTVLLYLSAWLAISLFSNIFPSVEDAVLMKERVYGKDGMNLFAKIIFAPGFAVMYIGSKLDVLGLTFVINAALTAFFIFSKSI